MRPPETKVISYMDERARFSVDKVGSFKFTSAKDWNIFDHWSDDWPDKDHYVSQHAVTQSQYDALSELIGAGANEQVVERFFKANPEVLSLVAFFFATGHHAAWLYPKNQIRPGNGAVGGLIPDYLLAGASSDGVSWFVLELKSPNTKAFVRKGKRVSLSGEANHGVCQLINYIDRSARSQAYLRDDIKLAGFREPRGILMIGTEEESRDELVREFKGAWNRMNPRVQIRSYSALLRELAQKIAIKARRAG